MGLDAKPPHLLQRIERARRVVSHCSQAAIRAYDEEALLSEACRTLLDMGDYCMAWFGEARPGNVALTPLAHAGAAPSGVRNIQLPWTADSGPRSPTLRAIREQRPQVLRGIPADPALRQRHPEAGPLGYAAACAFPIQFGPYGAGALTVYAREPDAFAPEEAALLRELAGDMAVAVAALRAKHASDVLEEQLEAAERRLRKLIENAPVAILQVDLDGRVLVANQALTQLLGYASPSEIVAAAPSDLSGHLDPPDQQRVARAVRSGPPYPPLELRIRRRDGGRVWVEVQAQPGGGAGLLTIEAFVRDLTPVRAAHLSSSRLAAVVDASEEGIIGIDAEGTVQTWSRGATALYGYTEAEAVGRPLADVYVPEDRRSEWESALAALCAGHRVQRFETQRLCKRHDLKDVSVAASPILDHDGQVVGASLIEHDAGERNRAQAAHVAQERQRQEAERLQELDRMRSEFMGRASHELNTPLTPVLLQVQALKGGPGLDARQAQALASIERNVLRLAVLVKDLLAASNLDLHDLHLQPTGLDLRDLAAAAVRSCQAQALEAGIALTVSPGDPVPAFADGDRVMQVLLNLLGNALKFTPRGGSVTVQVTDGDGAPTVTISDTGLGFPTEGRPILFRPFGRLHEDVPGAPVGSGLGLFISKGIVEESGGKMWADSPGPGQGCTVGFTVPRRAPSRPGRGIVAAKGFDGEARPRPPTPVAGHDAAAPSPVPPTETAPRAQDRTRSR